MASTHCESRWQARGSCSQAAPASARASATVYSGGGSGGGGSGGKKEKKKSKKGNDSEDVFSADLPVRLRKDVFMKGLSSLLSPAHSVGHAEDAVPTFCGGRAPVVEVYVNQVMGKKKMTHIVGLDRFGVDLDDLARRLSKKFAAAAVWAPTRSSPSSWRWWCRATWPPRRWVHLRHLLLPEQAAQRELEGRQS